MNESSQGGFAYWPYAMANAVLLWSPSLEPGIWCVAPDSAPLADAFRMGKLKVRHTDLPDLASDAPAEEFSTTVAVLGARVDLLDPVCRRVGANGRLFLWVMAESVKTFESRLAAAGLRLEQRYLVSHSLLRPAHVVPDTVAAVEAQTRVMRGLGGWSGLIKRLALRFGWRPKTYSARLIVAGRPR